MKSRRDLSEHIFKKRPCLATIDDVSAEALRSNPDYREPTEHQCSGCQRSFGRKALEDHVANGRCAAVRQQQEAALEPPAPAAAPAPQPARRFSDPDLSCVTSDTWSLLARLVGRVADYESLVPVWRCVFERAENRSLVVMSNVKGHGHLSCQHEDGSYRRLEAREAVLQALQKPLQVLRAHVAKPLHDVLEECLSPEVRSRSASLAVGWLVGYMEAKARVDRGCKMDAIGIPAIARNSFTDYFDPAFHQQRPAGDAWWDVPGWRSMV